MEEIWRPIKNYEGLYSVSNLGRVKSEDRWIEYVNPNTNKIVKIFKKGAIKSFADNGRGYKTVNLYKDNKGHTFYIHRLVVQSFIGDIPEGMTINHIDFNKDNNCLDNLEILTYSENNKHSSNAGRYKNKRGKKVKVIYENNSEFIYGSLSEASKEIGVHRDTLSKFFNPEGKEYNHGNKIFKKLGISRIELVN